MHILTVRAYARCYRTYRVYVYTRNFHARASAQIVGMCVCVFSRGGRRAAQSEIDRAATERMEFGARDACL